MYIPIDIHTVDISSQQPFDVYFKTQEGKLVLYTCKGEIVKPEVRERISQHYVSTLYIQKRDKQSYDLFRENHLSDLLFNDDLPAELRVKTAYDTIHNVAQLLFDSPRGEYIQRYKQAVCDTLDYVLTESRAIRHLIGLTTYDFSLFNHSINVGIFSIGLACELRADLSGDCDLNEAAAGFFLHDIGKTTVPREILTKKGPLTSAEWKLMKKHPEAGIELLDEHHALTPQMVPIILQHHERYDGSGYPSGLRGDDIHLLAKICSIADSFDGLTGYRPFRREYSSFQALGIMKNEMMQDFDPEFFVTFVRMFTGQ